MIDIRPATRDDGPAIESLLDECGILVKGVDYSDNEWYWLVAEMDGDVVGCIQVVGARPIGYLAFLAVRQSARKRSVTYRLFETAFANLRKMGVYAIVGAVSHDVESEKWMGVVDRVGSHVAIPSATIYVRSTAPVMAYRNGKVVSAQ